MRPVGEPVDQRLTETRVRQDLPPFGEWQVGGDDDRGPLGAIGDHLEQELCPGPRTGAELDRAYARADLLVHASHTETYGMVVTEALARGLPVLATDVGGVSEALGHGGVLIPPGDAAALGAALRSWLRDGELRERLRRAARERRTSLRPWAATAADIADALTAAACAEHLAGAAR